MSYVLKHDNEFNRLERQSHLPNYDFKTELKGFTAYPGQSVLDACCGSGIVTRYLAHTFPECSISACDIGDENLEKAREQAKKEGLNKIDFKREDVTQLSYPDGCFDRVVCRYAIQHVNKDLRQKAISEFKRILKPGGELWLIDFDGTLYNLFPVTDSLKSSFQKLENDNIIDLRIGRKLPAMLSKEDFNHVEFRIDCMNFKENGFEEEVKQLEARFVNAKDFLINSLGDEVSYQRFSKDFFECLSSPGATYFYNKFIVKAVK